MSSLPIFVYGTLRPGGLSEHLMDGSRWRRRATTAPIYTLWHLSWYPGMTERGATAVLGDVFEVPTSKLAYLDEYEGDSYRRTEVVLADGSTATAWVLRYPPIGRLKIDGGDWLEHLRQLGPCPNSHFSGMVSGHEHAGL